MSLFHKTIIRLSEEKEQLERKLQEAKEELLRSHDLSTKLVIENHILKEKLNQLESEAGDE